MPILLDPRQSQQNRADCRTAKITVNQDQFRHLQDQPVVTLAPDFVWAGNKRPNPIHPNNENVRHEIEMPTLPKSRRAVLSFNYVCGTNDTAATSKAHCKIEIFFRYVMN